MNWSVKVELNASIILRELSNLRDAYIASHVYVIIKFFFVYATFLFRVLKNIF